MKKYARTIFLIALLIIPGIIFFATTSPEKLPVGLYIIPFVYLFIVSYLATRFLLNRIGGRRENTSAIRLVPYLVAVLVTLVLLLGSLQQLAGRDIILIVVIGSTLIWYLRRISQ